jgi:hypothetical protein
MSGYMALLMLWLWQHVELGQLYQLLCFDMAQLEFNLE